MKYFEGEITQQFQRSGEMWKATINKNDPDHYWESKIVMYAESIQEAEYLQCVILKALNRDD